MSGCHGGSGRLWEGGAGACGFASTPSPGSRGSFLPPRAQLMFKAASRQQLMRPDNRELRGAGALARPRHDTPTPATARPQDRDPLWTLCRTLTAGRAHAHEAPAVMWAVLEGTVGASHPCCVRMAPHGATASPPRESAGHPLRVEVPEGCGCLTVWLGLPMAGQFHPGAAPAAHSRWPHWGCAGARPSAGAAQSCLCAGRCQHTCAGTGKQLVGLGPFPSATPGWRRPLPTSTGTPRLWLAIFCPSPGGTPWHFQKPPGPW